MYSTGSCCPINKKSRFICDSWNLDWISMFSISDNVNTRTKQRYARFAVYFNKKGSHYRLHRFILKEFGKNHVDHINGDTLDNRECNLRIVTPAQNAMNKRKRKKTSSKYKGVKWNKRTGVYEAKICHQYKDYYLGSFKTEKEAALAYNKKSLELHGEFGNRNVITKE